MPKAILLAAAALLSACTSEQPLALQQAPRSAAEVEAALSSVGSEATAGLAVAKDKITAVGESTQAAVAQTAGAIETVGNTVKAVAGSEEMDK